MRTPQVLVIPGVVLTLPSLPLPQEQSRGQRAALGSPGFSCQERGSTNLTTSALPYSTVSIPCLHLGGWGPTWAASIRSANASVKFPTK